MCDGLEEREAFERGEGSQVDVYPFLTHGNDFFHVVGQLFVAPHLFPFRIRFSTQGLRQIFLHLLESHFIALVVPASEQIGKDFILQFPFGLSRFQTEQELLLQEDEFPFEVFVLCQQ